MTMAPSGVVTSLDIAKRIPELVAAGNFQKGWVLPDGSRVQDFNFWVNAWIWAGYGFNFQAGLATTPITFAGAYDADAPDFFAHIPLGIAVIPTKIEVTFEAVGTESTMEIMALASPEADPSATITGGALATGNNKRVGCATPHGLTVSGGVDAAGITDPNVSGAFTFWRKQRPLTDTVATTENDRNELNWVWNYLNDGPPPLIIGSAAGIGGSAAAGASLSVYASSQAGTGFIIVEALVFPAAIAELLFGTTP